MTLKTTADPTKWLGEMLGVTGLTEKEDLEDGRNNNDEIQAAIREMESILPRLRIVNWYLTNSVGEGDLTQQQVHELGARYRCLLEEVPLEVLQPYVFDRARRVANENSIRPNRNDQENEDFVTESLAQVFCPRAKSPARILRYYGGAFGAWLTTTFNRIRLDEIRKTKRHDSRRDQTDLETGVQASPSVQPDMKLRNKIMQEAVNSAFTEADYSYIDSRKLIHVIAILGHLGLFIKAMPGGHWARYLNQLGQQYNFCVPTHWYRQPDKQRFIHELAELTGNKVGTIQQYVSRGKRLLANIPSLRPVVRDLYPEWFKNNS